MKRVTFIIPSLQAGGTERQLTYLAKNLREDHEVTILCTRRRGAFAKTLEDAGITVRLLPGWKGWGGWNPLMRARLRKLFREHRPDILHTFLFGFDWAANQAARETGVPVVISSRRQLATWKKPRHIRLQRKANRLVDCIVANSRAVAEFAARQEREDLGRFRIIPNCVDPDAFDVPVDPVFLRRKYGFPTTGHIVGIVANFSPVKDHTLFLETARAMLRRRDDIFFLMVGDGPLRKEFERRIRQLHIQDRVRILAAPETVAELYRVMTVSVLCSQQEGLPNVILESMAAGTPVVAAATGGIPEVIRHGETGYLVRSRTAEDFSRSIALLLDDPEKRTRIVEQANTYVREHHAVQKMTDAFRQLYNEMFVHAPGTRG